MRGTFVSLPDDGKIWIEFKYELLPNHCLICGLLGYPTRVYKDLREDGMTNEGIPEGKDETYAFRGLNAVTDLNGNPLGAGSEHWREKRSDELDGGRRSGRSSTASGMGSFTFHEAT